MLPHESRAAATRGRVPTTGWPTDFIYLRLRPPCPPGVASYAETRVKVRAEVFQTIGILKACTSFLYDRVGKCYAPPSRRLGNDDPLDRDRVWIDDRGYARL